jgi:hypothetical protein
MKTPRPFEPNSTVQAFEEKCKKLDAFTAKCNEAKKAYENDIGTPKKITDMISALPTAQQRSRAVERLKNIEDLYAKVKHILYKRGVKICECDRNQRCYNCPPGSPRICDANGRDIEGNFILGDTPREEVSGNWS